MKRRRPAKRRRRVPRGTPRRKPLTRKQIRDLANEIRWGVK